MRKIALLFLFVFWAGAAQAQFSGIGAPGLGGSGSTTPPARAGCVLPAIAAAVGFTNNVFCETWSNGYATIDMNDTRLPGFNWYTHGVFPNAPTQYVDSEIKSGSPVRTPRTQYIVVNNGTMSLSNISPNASDNWGNWLTTCAWDGSKIVGNFYTGGLFIDLVMYPDDANLGSAQEPVPDAPFVSDTFPGNWPTFWGDSTEFSGGTLAPGGHAIDFSVVELSPIPCTVPNNNCEMLQAIQELFPPFTYPPSSPQPYQYSTVNINAGALLPTIFPNWDYRQPHHYSMLWQTVAQGNGEGQYTFYTDGIQMVQMIYSPGGAIPSPLGRDGNPSGYPGDFIFGDTQHLCFYFSESLLGGHPNTLGTVQVWQLPILYITAPAVASAYQGYQQAIPGITVTDNSTPSLITVNLSDNAGILTATGAGVSGSGTTSITVTGASTSAINTSLSTLAFTGTTSDTLAITASDNAGNHAPATPVQVAVSPPCGQATSFLARTSGLTTLQQGAYVSLICGLVSDGDWANMDYFYMYVTNSLSTLALNLVQNKYNLTLNGSCTFVAFGGYTGDGSTCDQDTGFNPATAVGANYSLNLGFLGVCILNQRTTPNAFVWEMGADDFANTTGLTLLNSAGNAQWYVNANALTGLSEIPSGVAYTQGSWAIDRFNATAAGTNLWYNGIFDTFPGQASSSAMPNTDMIIMALGAAPGSDQSPDQFGYAWLGGLVNPTRVYNRAHTFIQAVGGPAGC